MLRLRTNVHRLRDLLLGDSARVLRLSLLLIVLLLVVGTLGYMLLERMDFADSLYMTVITVTTVGFGEVKPLTPAGRLFTILLIVVGIGAATTGLSNAIGVIVDRRFWRSVQKRRMERKRVDIKDHYIVCGYGRIGRQVVRDLRARGERFVIVDTSNRFEETFLDDDYLYVIGDATQDETLSTAGIERAYGFVAALNSDADNVMAVLTARGMNPRLYIVARAARAESVNKLRRAGANHVVSPYEIGGHRMALALLRPAVHDFLNQIFDVGDMDVDIGQVDVQPDSPLAGQTVGTCDLRKVRHLTILAIKKVGGDFTMNPGASQVIDPGDVLIVIGPPQAIYRVEEQSDAL